MSTPLRYRSYEKEILDLGPNHYSKKEYAACMKLLFRINKLLGFFSSTVKLLKQFPKNISVIDVGCGDGLFLLHLGRKFPHMRLTGVDISPDAIFLAEQNLKEWQAQHKINTIFQLVEPQADLNADIILTNMMCHHLTNAEIIIFMRNMVRMAKRAVIINDLHRHHLAHICFRVLSPFLFRNRLTMHDGLISIRRGFIRADWAALLHEAGIEHFKIKWCFPFRWQIILWK